MRSKKYYTRLMNFYYKYRDIIDDGMVKLDAGNGALSLMLDEYVDRILPVITKYNFGISNPISIGMLDVGQGNWKHFWETEEEKAMPVWKFAKDFIGEIFYCSDRMSWDRLIRINWYYNRIRERVDKK